MSSLSCGILYSTIVDDFDNYQNAYSFRHLECSVLVVWRRGYTRSHSELGS